VRLRSCALILLALPLIAQPQAPIGLIHGSLLECRTSEASGELTVRIADNRIFRFAFDDKTYFEREQEHSAPGAWKKAIGWRSLPTNRPRAR
jgi:hypothetical protein